jgi:hypothetical protein
LVLISNLWCVCEYVYMLHGNIFHWWTKNIQSYEKFSPSLPREWQCVYCQYRCCFSKLYLFLYSMSYVAMVKNKTTFYFLTFNNNNKAAASGTCEMKRTLAMFSVGSWNLVRWYIIIIIIIIIKVDGMRLRLWTAATNGPIINSPGDTWAWSTMVEWHRQGRTLDSSTRAVCQSYQENHLVTKNEKLAKKIMNFAFRGISFILQTVL